METMGCDEGDKGHDEDEGEDGIMVIAKLRMAMALPSREMVVVRILTETSPPRGRLGAILMTVPGMWLVAVPVAPSAAGTIPRSLSQEKFPHLTHM